MFAGAAMTEMREKLNFLDKFHKRERSGTMEGVSPVY
jgi:hypothetical protein